jgi:hypothetical protein
VLVFVEDAAQSVASSDVEVVESARFGDRLGERASGCRGVERPVGLVLVVERFVLTECVQEMAAVHDQGPVEQFGPAGPYPPLHDRIHPRHLDSGLHDGDTFAVKDRVEGGRVAGCRPVPIPTP